MNLPSYVLNDALNFSMEFGENWLSDIGPRLLKKYSQLTKSELNNCSKLCKEINRTAHNYVSKNPVLKKNELTFIEFSEFEKMLLKKYDWINNENLKTLYSQSCYYALK